MKGCIQLAKLILLLSFTINFTSCTHSPIYEDDMMTNPIDTIVIVPPDTMSLDTCNTELVYFDMQILPILRSNCAFSGCHDAASAEDGVILESYETVIATADVEPFDLEHSEIYEVLVEDEDKRMPPAPNGPWDNEQINLIARWILQGGEDLHCDPDLDPCPNEDISFQGIVMPIMKTNCEGCHGGNSPSGGVKLDSYESVQQVATDGRLSGTIGWKTGFVTMPPGGDKLSNCNIAQIESWINDGAQNN